MDTTFKAPGGLMLEGIFVFPDPDEAGAWCYVPGEPAPERSSSGVPSLHLWMTGASPILQLGTHWAVSEDRLTAVRRQLVDIDRACAQQPEILRVRPAPVARLEAALLLGPSAEKLSLVATSTTSGAPPYTALFNVSLPSELAEYAVAALSGTRGHLYVEYHGVLGITVSVAAMISGDARAAVLSLADNSSASRVATVLEEAVERGDLTLTVAVPAGIDEDERRSLIADVNAAAAALLVEVARTPGRSDHDLDASNFAAEARRDLRQGLPFSIRTDVGAWRADATDPPPILRLE